MSGLMLVLEYWKKCANKTDGEGDNMNMKQLMARWERGRAGLLATIEKFSEDDMLWHVLEHEIHHRAELSLTLGLLGHEGLNA